MTGYKKITALGSAFVVASVNHFVMHQPNPDLDKLLAVLTVAYHTLETLHDSVLQIVSLIRQILAKDQTDESNRTNLK